MLLGQVNETAVEVTVALRTADVIVVVKVAVAFELTADPVDVGLLLVVVGVKLPLIKTTSTAAYAAVAAKTS